MSEAVDLRIALAYMLCVLSYFIGLILKSSPSRRVRAISHILCEDSFIIAIFITAISSMRLIEWICSLYLPEGATYESLYDSFRNWIVTKIGILSGFRVMTIPIEALLGTMSIFPFTATIGGAIMTLMIVKAIADMLSRYWFELLLIGIILYSIPRIGKMGGSGLLTFTIVFYLGLPFMPRFIDWLMPFIATEMPIDYSKAGVLAQLFETVSKAVLSQAFPLIILPIFYLLILFALNIGVARMMGGRELRIPGL